MPMPTRKHPGGRPKKAADLRRSRKVEISFTESELALIADAAVAMGEPLATYARRILLLRAPEDLVRGVNMQG